MNRRRWLFRIIPLLVCALLYAASMIAQTRRDDLQNQTWRLVRLGDIVIRPTDAAAISVQFKDTTYTLAGICNQAGGKYWTRGISRIGFEPAVGTLRACPGINLDARFAEVLSRTNRFRLHSSNAARSLSLRRGLRVLAILEAK